MEISVTDRGIGIAPEHQERVFERFFRVDPARSRATGGTGLGLAIVKHVLANHGGEVRLWSSPGTGSTFTLRLPLHAEPRHDRPTRRRGRPSRTGHRPQPVPDRLGSSPSPDEHGGAPVTRVLIVEDEESFADPLAFLLRKEGFTTAVAGTGPDALEEFDRNGADIVLLDLMLPGMSGTDVCKALRTALRGAGDHGDRAGQRDRQGGRPGARRRRLRHQAVLGARADRPDPRGAAPRRRAGPRPTAARRAGRRPGPDGRRAARGAPSTGAEVPLPLKEFDLLEYLLRNAGRVLTRGQLIDRVWGADYVGDTKTLDVHVKRLRSKIEPDPSRPAAPGHRPRPGLQVRGLIVSHPRDRGGGVRPLVDAIRSTGWISEPTCARGTSA